jgi:hypothetical protein
MTAYLIGTGIVIAACIGWIVFELTWTWIHGRNLRKR